MADKYNTKVTTPSDCEITFTRTFDAPRDMVWKAWTEPEMVKQWMIGMPGHTLPVCDIDLKVGGALRYVWIIEEGKEMGLRGVFREITVPERIVHTEIFDDWPQNETLVTTIFSEKNSQTVVIMTILYDSKKTRDIMLESQMEEGVAHTYENLDNLLAKLTY